MTLKHTHQYERVIVGSRKVMKDPEGKKRIVRSAGTEVFKCALPGCGSFKMRDLAIGDRSLCWTCGEELILTADNTKRKRPIHESCKKVRLKETA